MTQKQIDYIIENKAIPYDTKEIQLKETHISWVIMTDNYVFKIKKPVKFNFLDFSTLKKRKYYCEEEVKLNRRLAPFMYLGICKVKNESEEYHIGKGGGILVDYAVLMKRMDETKQLNLLLDKGEVNSAELVKLADKVASFHKKATVITDGINWRQLYNEFENILSVKDFFVKHFGEDSKKFIQDLNEQVYQFLNKNQERIRERNENGNVIDGHGDLHSKNIFLLKNPVVFDCLEFNQDLRKIDQLNDIAFLCMDIERYNQHDLSRTFSERYFSKTGSMETNIDKQLFLFYKLYRANVRMKVLAIEAQQTDNKDTQQNEVLHKVKQYLELCKEYSKDLKRS